MGRWACNIALPLLLTLLLPLGSIAAATVSTSYYDLAILNLRRGNANVQLFLQLKPNVQKALLRAEPGTDDLVARLDIRIGARIPATGQLVAERHFKDDVRQPANADPSAGVGDLLRTYPFPLSPGIYLVDVEITDRVARRVYYEQLDFECRSQGAPAISDPQLDLLKAFGPVTLTQPLYGLHVENQPDSLRFQVEVLSPTVEVLTARTILYRLQESGPVPSSDVERLGLRHYVTAAQRRDILHLPAGETTFAAAFSLQDAPDGEYLLDFSLFRDQTLAATANRRFVVDWPLLREIFADLDSAISMMALVASDAQRAALRTIADADQKQRDFISWWERRAPQGSGAQTAMKRYFSRVFHARATFSTPQVPGWESAQGRTYVLYGPPDRTHRIDFPGMPAEVWAYAKWNLCFLFRNTPNGMELVDI